MADKPTVIEALSAAMAEVQAVGKNSRNLEQGYNFRGVDAVVNAVGPVLRKHGVLALPMLQDASYRDVRTTKDKPARECTVRVRYRFYGPAGDFVEAEVPGESMDFSDKGAAKAMSVAYRIVLLQALCIPTDEPDPDSQSYERGQQDDWASAAKPPTEAQAAKSEELTKAITVADSEAGLRSAWEAIVAAFKADEITITQANSLRAGLSVRKTELEATRDGTGDGNGSGVEPSSAGSGPGPDGAGAGESGPGRDGETGSVRPGVQPGVSGGGGVDRGAQAHRGDRDAPAAAGQRRG